ncbi:MAG: hypothetical protein JKY70_04960 [Mucilaginibacter sp.]|nr:hypothetical protein [Mucilaginibacter sp.]
MENKEDLTGILVLVNPALKDDPVSKQGQTGLLLYLDPEKDDAYVAFGKGEQALYSSDALLVFKTPQEIYQELMTHTRELPVADMKALYRIGMLLDDHTSEGIKEAMKIAAENPAIQDRALTTLQEKLGLDVEIRQAQSHTVQQSRGR